MSSNKNVLTIKGYWNAGGDLQSEIGGFAVIEKLRGAVKTVKLTVNRKPDQHSNRLAMFAHLHSRSGYQNLGFPEANLSVDTFADNGKLVSRKIYSFSDVRIESFFVRSDGADEITFICGGFSEFAISQVEVFLN